MKDNERRRLEKNRLVLFTALAVGTGFLSAFYLGAFSKTDLKEIPPWLTVFVSAIATAISGYAVFLVGQTLRSTRETLELTRQMALDQKRIGEAQIRPWVMLDSCAVTRSGEDYVITIFLKNFGNTPTKALKLGAHLEGGIFETNTLGETARLHEYGIHLGTRHINTIPPGMKSKIQFRLNTESIKKRCENFIELSWEYKNADITLTDGDRAFIHLDYIENKLIIESID